MALKSIADSFGLSSNELVKITGICKSSLANIFEGNSTISANRLNLAMKALKEYIEKTKTEDIQRTLSMYAERIKKCDDALKANAESRERRKREWKENQAVSVQQEGEGYEAF